MGDTSAGARTSDSNVQAPPGGGLVKQIVGYSSHWQQESYEGELGERIRGLFTAALLSGLNGGAARLDGDGWVVTTESLRRYVKDNVGEETRNLGVTQVPQIEIPDGAESIVLTRLETPPDAVRVKVTTEETETFLVLNDNHTGKRREPLQDGRATLELRPGAYGLITLPSGYDHPDGAINVWAGKELSIELRSVE